MTLKDKVHANRLLALQRAEELGKCVSSLSGVGHLSYSILPVEEAIPEVRP